MKLFMEKVWDNLGLFEAAGQDEEQKTDESERKNKRHKSQANGNTAPSVGSNVVTLPTVPAGQPPLGSGNGLSSKQLKVMVVEPVSFDDAQHVADYLKAKKPVVINFENTDAEISRRMIDFISGTAYALNGSIQKIGNHIFLCAPHNVDVSYTSRDEMPERQLFSWK